MSVRIEGSDLILDEYPPVHVVIPEGHFETISRVVIEIQPPINLDGRETNLSIGMSLSEPTETP